MRGRCWLFSGLCAVGLAQQTTIAGSNEGAVSDFVVEMFVELKGADGLLSLAEYRQPRCQSTNATAQAFCDEFTVNDGGCALLAQYAATKATTASGAACNSSSVPAKLDTFPINVHHSENNTQSMFKIAVYQGDYARIQPRSERVCRRLELDYPACDSLRGALETRIIEREVARAVALQDTNALATLVAQLQDENQRLRTEIKEKAQAFRDLRRETLREQHHLERQIRQLEQHTKTRPSRHVQELVVSAQGSRKTVVARKRKADQSQRIDRHHVANFSYAHYLEYARSFTPVIITGLDKLPGRPGLPGWSLDKLKQLCGDADVVLKRKKNPSPDNASTSAAMSTAMWAGIEQVAKVPLKDFLADYEHQDNNRSWPNGYADLYLHDMSVRKFCPQLLESFVVPRYFADDRLQQLEHSSQRDYWPSLFIGDASTASALHADWGATSAWMGLLQGRKHWVIAKPSSRAALFELMPNANAPTEGRFAADWIHDYSNASRYTRTADEVYEDVLEAGEVLFIPADCPHQVQNLEKTLAVAANFVDSANVDLLRRYFTRSRHASTGSQSTAYSKMLRQLQQPIPQLNHTLDPSFSDFKASYRVH